MSNITGIHQSYAITMDKKMNPNGYQNSYQLINSSQKTYFKKKIEASQKVKNNNRKSNSTPSSFRPKNKPSEINKLNSSNLTIKKPRISNSLTTSKSTHPTKLSETSLNTSNLFSKKHLPPKSANQKNFTPNLQKKTKPKMTARSFSVKSNISNKSQHDINASFSIKKSGISKNLSEKKSKNTLNLTNLSNKNSFNNKDNNNKVNHSFVKIKSNKPSTANSSRNKNPHLKTPNFFSSLKHKLPNQNNTSIYMSGDSKKTFITKSDKSNNKKIMPNQHSFSNSQDKDLSTTSESGNTTKNHFPIFNPRGQEVIEEMKNEGTIEYSNSKENNPIVIRKRIKCMHDLSKTGLAGDEKKVNQDNFFIFKNFNNGFENIYMGVCDGHGTYGHEVSGYIRENLPMDLNHMIKASKLNIKKDDLSQVIKDTFIRENQSLLANRNIDSKLSGTTCVSVIYTPEKLIIANIGDSRIVLGKQLSNGEWRHEDLSRDHTPEIKEEADRIKKVGGRIRPMRDDDGTFIGPLRVYMKEEEMPGLAMTRSFGDYFASTAGTISEPEVTEHKFNEEDKFIVLASDGLYEFMESKEVVNIIKDFYLKDDIVSCCEFLYKESCRRWIDEEEDTIDDITIIVVFFE